MLAVSLLVSNLGGVDAFSMQMSSPLPKPKGCAAKPYEKKKVAVFGAGGYLGGNIYGFLQRAGSLYGTGIAGINSPRAIVATATGSLYMNGVLSKNFILAQADESFVKLTDMTSVEMIESRLKGFDAAILGTRCTLEKRPVTGGSYDKTPNDKTIEFYMDRPRSLTLQGIDNPQYSLEIFQNAIEACSKAGIQHVVVVETDQMFVDQSVPGNKYLDVLESGGVKYTYIRLGGEMDNMNDYTYIKGLQGDLSIAAGGTGAGQGSNGAVLNREDIAAVCVQSLMSCDWSSSRIFSVNSQGSLDMPEYNKKTAPRPPQQEWCVNSQILQSILASIE